MKRKILCYFIIVLYHIVLDNKPVTTKQNILFERVRMVLLETTVKKKTFIMYHFILFKLY